MKKKKMCKIKEKNCDACVYCITDEWNIHKEK